MWRETKDEDDTNKSSYYSTDEVGDNPNLNKRFDAEPHLKREIEQVHMASSFTK